MKKGFTLIELMIVVAIIAIIAAIAIPSLLQARRAANETNAIGGLKQTVSHQATFKQVDADGNGVKDYWTGDLAGLYATPDVKGDPVKYIDIGFAKADNTPMAAWDQAAGTPVPKAGYFYEVMTLDAPVGGLAYQLVPTTTAPAPGNAATFNMSKFAFTSYPSMYGREGVKIFIVNEEGVIYGVDNSDDGAGIPIFTLTWPGVDPTSIAASNGRLWGQAAD